MAGSQPIWLATFKAQVAASPGKSAALGVCTLVLLVIVVIQLAGRRQPVRAAAAPTTTAVTATPQVPTVTALEAAAALRFLVDANTPPPPELPEDVERDPFSRPLMASAIVEAATEVQQDQPEEEELVTIDPNEWRLEATYLSRHEGDDAFAVINGTVLRLRDRLGDFELATIGPRYVVIESPQRRLVLHMR